ncbi:aldolase/citrate lyase family protein [Limibaculum sp. FT325]|uniref:HpcH/HpaI aldolase family protein n=1 Tax=Thermohalobaculum sediminis TaxID=2939436 RepID=UPI0020BEAEC2|nr:aldolase/citrate lyase family protein [Limibaculum sediminis]MCL5775388.1 aldolase/citrate lyase family protein [Limibaculum sediminis]
MTATATPKEKLAALAGRLPARCLWLGLPSPVAAEIAGQAGAEIAVIDAEHGAIGVERMADMLRALAPSGTGTIVRVGEMSEARVKHALDAGAGGVMIPYVETAAEAEAVVRAALYPPLGARGQAVGVIRASRYGREPDYVAQWNDRAIVAVQIESHHGLTNAVAIAEVEGVDMLFFGPFDYAQDAGLDPAADGAVLWQVFRQIVAAARGAGKTVGVFPWPGATPADLAAAGADLVAVASDVATLAGGLASAVQAISLSISDVS